jgi:hypothetical protein
MAEPPRFGTLTTKYAPRKTIDTPAIARPWQTGYAYPDYVNEEPLGAGVFRTKYLARKTVDALVPEYLSGDVVEELQTTPDLNIRGGASWLAAAERRYQTGLGGVGYTTPINADAGQAWIAAAERRYGYALGDDAHAGDAIGEFGRQAARYILATVHALPPSERKLALRTAFDNLEPGLWNRVTRKANELARAGMPAPAALERAIASQVSYGLLQELIRTGKTGRVRAQTLLGACCGLGADERIATTRGKAGPAGERDIGSGTPSDPWRFSAAMLAGTERDHRLIKHPKIQAAWNDALTRVARLPGWAGVDIAADIRAGKLPFAKFKNDTDGGKTWGLYRNEAQGWLLMKRVPEKKRGILGRVHGAIRDIGRAVVGAVKDVAGAVADAAEAIGDGLKNLACKVVGSEAGQLAAAGGALAAGEPPQVGQVGAQIAAGLCAEGAPAGPPLPPAPGKFPTGLVIGAAAAVGLVYLLTRKKAA